MRKSLIALVVLFASAASAFAQAPILWTNFAFPAGAAMPSGYTFTNPNLFAPTSASLQAAGTPFGVSFWMKIVGIPYGGKTYLFTSQGMTAVTTTKGFVGTWDSGQAAGFEYFFGVYPALNSAGYTGGCGRKATTCTRDALVDDGDWHHMCYTWDATNGTTSYIDGALIDNNPQVGTGYTPSTNFWTIGPPGQVIPISYRDFRVYAGPVLSGPNCQTIYQMGKRLNQVPAAGPLATNMAAHWTLDSASCTPSGASTVCTDSSGNANDLNTDQTAPIVTITTPTVGVKSGAVSFTGTCSDPIVCLNVRWTVDGQDVSGPVTTSPYTFSWASNTFVDGTHVIAINGQNAGGVIGTASVTITTSNSTTAKNYFFDPVAGSDSNNCLSAGTACQTIEKATCAFTYHGGDTISFKQGTTVTLNTSPSCAAAAGANVGFIISGSAGELLLTTQNFFPGGSLAPLVISTYGGGTCNVFGTTTGCVTFALNPASTINVPIILGSPGSISFSNAIVIGGTAATISPSGAGGIGIYLRNNTAQNRSGVTLSNTKIIDFTAGIQAINFNGNSTFNCSIRNNLITESDPTSPASVGIIVQSANNQCTVSGNYISNVGCPSTGECIQGGILISNGAGPLIDEFNVTTALHYNIRQPCNGGPFANWTYDTIGVIVQFNESYNNFPHQQGCDAGDYDIDGSNRNNIVQYNYAHDTWGGALIFFTNNQAGPTWINNTARYNIFEHTTYGATFDGTGAIVGTGGGTFPNMNFHNNTIWDTLQGAIDPVTGNVVRRAVFGFVNCPGMPSYVANNIFAASQNATGFAQFYGTFANIDCHNTVVYRNNDWFAISGTPLWSRAAGFAGSFTDYASFAAAVGETGGQTVDPMLVDPGNHPTCYAGGTPAGPQPCDAGMKLQAGSPMLGTGINLNTSFGLDIGGFDYYGSACPGTMGGTGINIGADACGNP